MKLVEWTQHYIKFKDCMKKQIEDIKVENNIIFIKEKAEEKVYFVEEELSKALSKIQGEGQKVFIVCLNTKENIKTLIQQWNIIIKHEYLTMLFVNPKTNQNWIIHPRTHYFISEKKALKEGIKTLHESISIVG